LHHWICCSSIGCHGDDCHSDALRELLNEGWLSGENFSGSFLKSATTPDCRPQTNGLDPELRQREAKNEEEHTEIENGAEASLLRCSEA